MDDESFTGRCPTWVQRCHEEGKLLKEPSGDELLASVSAIGATPVGELLVEAWRAGRNAALREVRRRMSLPEGASVLGSVTLASAAELRGELKGLEWAEKQAAYHQPRSVLEAIITLRIAELKKGTP